MPPKISSGSPQNLWGPSHSGTAQAPATSRTDLRASAPGSQSPALSGLLRREPGKQRNTMPSGRTAPPGQADYNPPSLQDIAANIQKGIDAWMQKNGQKQPEPPGKGLDQINKERVAWIKSRVQDTRDVIQTFQSAQKPE